MKSYNIIGLLLLGMALDMPLQGSSSNSERHDAQRRSLRHLYFRGSPMPPVMTAEEKTKALKLMKSGRPKREVDILKKQFGTELDLVTYATRDSDGDGVLDFRFHLDDGRFFEGDVDVDGDGIMNVYDSAPFDPGIGGKDIDGDGIPDRDFVDINKNSIPDHIDWSILKKNKTDGVALAQRQAELFHDHSIVVVDRTATFNLVAIDAVYDTIKKVYRKTFYRRKVLPTLRVVSAENFPLLFEEDPVETDALYHAAAQTLMLYRHSLKAHPLVQLGLSVHEIGHTLQYALDFDRQNPQEENKKNFYMSPNLIEAMKPFGWAGSPVIEKWQDFELISPMYDVGYPEYYLKGKSTEVWTQWINDIRYEVGSKFLEDARVKKEGIVGIYSLFNIWEWLSDNEIAYVYFMLEKQASLQGPCASLKPDALRAKVHGRVSRFWPDFYYPNIETSRILKYLKTVVPMTQKDQKDLAKKYIEANFCL